MAWIATWTAPAYLGLKFGLMGLFCRERREGKRRVFIEVLGMAWHNMRVAIEREAGDARHDE